MHSRKLNEQALSSLPHLENPMFWVHGCGHHVATSRQGRSRSMLKMRELHSRRTCSVLAVLAISLRSGNVSVFQYASTRGCMHIAACGDPIHRTSPVVSRLFPSLFNMVLNGLASTIDTHLLLSGAPPFSGCVLKPKKVSFFCPVEVSSIFYGRKDKTLGGGLNR